MALFKGLKETKERKKAKSFYEQMPKLSGDPRELRKLRALIGARLTGFIDMTFIEGAKDMESFQESGAAGTSPGGFSAAYKAVKTVGGVVVVYLPQKYTNFFYELGSKYQAANFTKNRVLALADDTAKEISQFLKLDNEISALGFLRIEAENEESAPSADHDDESETGEDPNSSS